MAHQYQVYHHKGVGNMYIYSRLPLHLGVRTVLPVWDPESLASGDSYYPVVLFVENRHVED